MKVNVLPNIEFLNECFHYVDETGELLWNARPLEHFKSLHDQRAFNARFANKPAGYMSSDGYMRVMVKSKMFLLHRIAYLIQHGEQPPMIDHRDGNRSNNRMSNLRPATHSQNNLNAPARSYNKSGIKGVYFHKDTGKWQAQVSHNGKPKNLGLFKSISEAEAVAISFRSTVHGEFANHGRR